jgi:hypothetical protein
LTPAAWVTTDKTQREQNGPASPSSPDALLCRSEATLKRHNRKSESPTTRIRSALMLLMFALLIIGHHISNFGRTLGYRRTVSCEGSVTSMQRGEIIEGERAGDIAIPRPDFRAAVI